MEERLILCNCTRLTKEVEITDEELNRLLSTITEFKLHDEDLPETVEIKLTGNIYSDEDGKSIIVIGLSTERFFIEYLSENDRLLQYLVRRMIFHNLLAGTYHVLGFSTINWKKDLEIEE